VVFVLLGVVQGSLASRMLALKAHAGLSDRLREKRDAEIEAAATLTAAELTGEAIVRSDRPAR
jgi:hypothetical protein